MPCLLADVDARSDPGQARVLVEQPGEPPGLVAGKRVHRVQQQRLDPPPPAVTLAGAVVQDRV
jgi:hypothetical protein